MKTNSKLISESGPIMPVEVAKELWLQLHKTRNAESCAPKMALEPTEERLYQHLTKRFEMEAAIFGVRVEQA
ncbi:MAG: hypothetical protein H7A47_17120 [Verrucomicrobiales bacterium]|nr:hypothetical protein [Verrucomicrobiales bacterium]